MIGVSVIGVSVIGVSVIGVSVIGVSVVCVPVTSARASGSQTGQRRQAIPARRKLLFVYGTLTQAFL
ncbi:MAG: hypothetical protein CMI03_12165 [Oceanospirillaceae bacterium]|nr:hypothetical protein [Oceanospirillaceae bacterium]